MIPNTNDHRSARDEGEMHNDIIYPSAVPFVLMHFACFAAYWSGITVEAIWLAVGLYWLRMFAVTGAYHRYFSHRTYQTSRVFQFVLALLAQTTTQKSVIWWAAKHRHHHKHTDTVEDVHSPRHFGFWYSHFGWIFAKRHDATALDTVPDLTRYPELMWLHRVEQAPAVALAILCYVVAGWPGLVVGFFWSTVAVSHATFCINSLAHVHGSRRYVTGDDSRNNFWLSIFTMGEGWHNNHHAFQYSTRQGFKWWEWDPTYYILNGFAALGLVWDLRAPPAEVLANEHRLSPRVIEKAAHDLAATFQIERMAQAIREAYAASPSFHLPAVHMPTMTIPSIAELQERMQQAQAQAREAFANSSLANVTLPSLPSIEEVRQAAYAMYARTPSLDDIAARAQQMVAERVHARLVTAPT
jgi:stearoyl-CoA desaturase (Delta-9 desaturase)